MHKGSDILTLKHVQSTWCELWMKKKQKKLPIMYTLRMCTPSKSQTGNIMYKRKPESRRSEQIISGGVGEDKKELILNII